MRAEEVVLSLPDGRRIRTLINATPIHAEDGTVATVVVTMQDLAPLDEIERLRTEFLGLVSHQLRTPLAAIKGSVATVLDSLADSWIRPNCASSFASSTSRPIRCVA